MRRPYTVAWRRRNERVPVQLTFVLNEAIIRHFLAFRAVLLAIRRRFDPARQRCRVIIESDRPGFRSLAFRYKTTICVYYLYISYVLICLFAFTDYGWMLNI